MLIQSHKTKVYHWAYNFLHDAHLAEDLAQEVFLKVWKALPRFDSRKSKISTWLYTITRNTCFTELQKQSQKPTFSLDDDHFVVEEMTSDNTTSEKLEHFDLFELLQKLPEKYSQALTLFYLEQKSYEEAAELMEIPLGTFKATVHRAKKRLHTILNSTPKRLIT